MNRAFIYIFLGAALWGTIGFYVKNLYAFGFTSMEQVTLRAVSTAIILFVVLFFSSRTSLRLQQWTDVKYFIGTGIFSIILFNFSLFKTIDIASIPVATALLYTAPAFVIILSYFLFKEPITRYKLVALLFTLIGTALVVGIIPLNIKDIPFITLIFGLLSGLGYALYSIFSKYALQKYNSMTITAYTFFVATIVLLPFFPYQEKFHLLLDWKVMLFVIAFGLFPTALAYFIYTAGLNRTEASKASIISTIEPVVATLIGIFIFFEPFSVLQAVGMGAIIAAVIIIQLDPKNEPKRMISRD